MAHILSIVVGFWRWDAIGMAIFRLGLAISCTLEDSCGPVDLILIIVIGGWLPQIALLFMVGVGAIGGVDAGHSS